MSTTIGSYQAIQKEPVKNKKNAIQYGLCASIPAIAGLAHGVYKKIDNTKTNIIEDIKLSPADNFVRVKSAMLLIPGSGDAISIADNPNDKMIYKVLIDNKVKIKKTRLHPWSNVDFFIDCLIKLGFSPDKEKIMTFVNNGRSEILYAAIRIGNGTSEVDNFHKGGMGVAINTKDGKLKGNAIDKDLNEYKKHPVTGTYFNKFEIPYWKETKKLVLDAAKVNQNIKVVGWDVAITKNGPVLVEGNRRPGFDLVQVLSKKGRKDIIYHVMNNLNK
jgi:hypothetical protein